MNLSFSSGIFVLKNTPFEQREIIRKQNFSWNKDGRHWQCSEPRKAIFFYEVADESAKAELDAFLAAQNLSLQEAQDASVIVDPITLIYQEELKKYALVNLPFEQKNLAKDARFRFDWIRKQWETDDHETAYQFVEYANEALKRTLSEIMEQRKASFVESRSAANDDISIPAPENLSYLPYQRAGISYAVKRQNTLIADDMGLGKTIQAIGFSNYFTEIRSILIVCPASLKLNWKREFEKWDVKGLTVDLAIGKDFPETDVAIINYDILSSHSDKIHSRQFDLLIVDEAHYLKNPKTIRCKNVFGDGKTLNGIKATRKLFLTGTPILNRPAEGWVLFSNLAPEVFGNYPVFTARYADGHRTNFGWQATGASNLDELQAKLRSTIMVRRMKMDVLKELPPKRRQIIEFSGEGVTKLVKQENQAYEQYQMELLKLMVDSELAKADSEAAYIQTLERMKDQSSVSFQEFSKVRKEVATKKLPYIIDHISSALECGKVVVFAHHHSVIDALKEAFPKAVVVTGETPIKKRQEAVDSFQQDPEVKLFIGNIQAAGVGLTLTASSHVIFCELSWVPGEVSQAEDRCHRLGQVNSVLVQHLLLEDSIDVTMAKRLIEKQEIIDKALDKSEQSQLDFNDTIIRQTPPMENVSFAEIRKRVDFQGSASSKVTASELEEAAVDLHVSSELSNAVIDGLRYLAMVCDGAIQVDGHGFNKFDSAVGSRLAALTRLTPKQVLLGQRILYKYHRQLPVDINEAIRQKVA